MDMVKPNYLDFVTKLITLVNFFVLTLYPKDNTSDQMNTRLVYFVNI